MDLHIDHAILGVIVTFLGYVAKSAHNLVLSVQRIIILMDQHANDHIELASVVKDHDVKLDDHGQRLTVIEIHTKLKG